MATTMQRTQDLPATFVTQQDFYDLMETMTPMEALTDAATGDMTLGVSGNRLKANLNVPRWRKYELAFDDDDFVVSAVSAASTLLTLGEIGLVQRVVAKHSVAFAGGGASSCTLQVGTAATANKYLAAFDVFAAVADGTLAHAANASAVDAKGTQVIATLTADVNLDTLTAGAVTVWVEYAELY